MVAPCAYVTHWATVQMTFSKNAVLPPQFLRRRVSVSAILSAAFRVGRSIDAGRMEKLSQVIYHLMKEEGWRPVDQCMNYEMGKEESQDG